MKSNLIRYLEVSTLALSSVPLAVASLSLSSRWLMYWSCSSHNCTPTMCHYCNVMYRKILVALKELEWDLDNIFKNISYFKYFWKKRKLLILVEHFLIIDPVILLLIRIVISEIQINNIVPYSYRAIRIMILLS